MLVLMPYFMASPPALLLPQLQQKLCLCISEKERIL